MGDSFAFGCWTDRIKTTTVGIFDSLMDSEKFEVLNFGVCGYRLLDIELQIKEEVISFKPDYIILMFWNGNDFSDTYFGTDKYIVEDGTLKWKLNSDNKILFNLKEFVGNTSIYTLFTKTFDLIRARLIFSLDKPVTPAVIWSQKKYSKFAMKAKDLTLKALNDIRKLCNSNHIQFVIVSIPFKEQVYCSWLSNEDYDFTLPQKYLEEFSKTYSVLYLDLLSILRSYVRKNNKDIYLQNDVHFNNDGHYIVGKIVAQFFKEKIINN